MKNKQKFPPTPERNQSSEEKIDRFETIDDEIILLKITCADRKKRTFKKFSRKNALRVLRANAAEYGFENADTAGGSKQPASRLDRLKNFFMAMGGSQ